jgi:hypothetical protein
LSTPSSDIKPKRNGTVTGPRIICICILCTYANALATFFYHLCTFHRSAVSMAHNNSIFPRGISSTELTTGLSDLTSFHPSLCSQINYYSITHLPFIWVQSLAPALPKVFVNISIDFVKCLLLNAYTCSDLNILRALLLPHAETDDLSTRCRVLYYVQYCVLLNTRKKCKGFKNVSSSQAHCNTQVVRYRGEIIFILFLIRHRIHHMINFHLSYFNAIHAYFSILYCINIIGQ